MRKSRMRYRYYHKQNYHNQIIYALPAAAAAVEVVDVVVEAAVVAAEAVVV